MDNKIEIETYRVKNLIEQVGHLYKMGSLSWSDAISIVGNLADLDKANAENEIDEMVFEFLKEMIR